MSGGDAIVQGLLRHGVDTVFALPGVQTYGLCDAMYRAGDRLRVIGARHEQGCGYMAFGYAKSTGRVGVYAVVPGPGMLNASAALCTAYSCSTPVLCLTGEIPSNYLGRGLGHLHELPDQLATLRSLTKWAQRIEHPAEAPGLVAEAFVRMHEGRPRPVALEMPWDVFEQQAPVPAAAAPAPCPEPMQPDPDALDRAVRLLQRAERPMIMVGGGAQHAPREILALAETLQAPVVPYRGGRGIVSEEHPLGFNCASGYRLWRHTDVLLAIGTRLLMKWFHWPPAPPGMKTILVDIDPMQHSRLTPEVGIVADARAVAATLGEALGRAGRRAARTQEFEAIKAATRHDVGKVQPHVAYLDAIRRVLPRDGFFVEEICQAGFTSHYAFPIYLPRTFVTCGAACTLGFGMQTALGVKVAHPDKQVVSICGDGGFMFGVQELATAVQYGINLVTVVFNNHAYGNVYYDQKRRFDGRILGSELVNPDFVKLAESMGVSACRVQTPRQLQTALERAFGSDAPALIEIPVERGAEASPWEFLMPSPPAETH